MLGLYDEIKSDYPGRVFKHKGAAVFIYKKNDKWFCGPSVDRDDRHAWREKEDNTITLQ